MDILAALQQVDGSVILGGNLDPTAVFHNSSVDEVVRQTEALLEQTRGIPNFILSSGCDIPPETPVENIRAFYEVARQQG
jgi:uroporphyrinogen decarboxylase